MPALARLREQAAKKSKYAVKDVQDIAILDGIGEDEISDLVRALAKLKVFVQQLPMESSDGIFAVSTRKLSNKELTLLEESLDGY